MYEYVDVTECIHTCLYECALYMLYTTQTFNFLVFLVCEILWHACMGSIYIPYCMWSENLEKFETYV